MFSPATDPLLSIIYQTDDHLPPLPPLILATEDDQQTSYHQYELANYCTYSSSGCESTPSSYLAVLLPDQGVIIKGGSGRGGLARRSSGSHSLLIPPLINDNNHTRLFNYQPAAVNVMNNDNVHRLVDLIDSCSVSTGDLQLQMQHPRYQLMSQQQHRPSSSKESSSSSIIEGMLSKACRYSPEEKKERIERYKTKRSHRNFNKKIKYACRKTLADSRPRIRGRFARNYNNEDDSPDDKCAGNRNYELANYWWEDNEDDNWLDLFNAAWLLK